MRRILLIGLIALLPLLVADRAGATSHQVFASKGVPVLELYTSQGCSSCPPADLLLAKYAARDDIIALTLPVDYWDYLGWKDTLANSIYSDRQRAYARARGDNAVYTPQVVIDGLDHVVGSAEAAIERSIRTTRKQLLSNRVDLTMRAHDDALIIEAGAAPKGAAWRTGTVWLALVTKEVKVVIERGENKGRTVTYVNVVRELTPVGKWEGDTMRLKLPMHHLMRRGANGCTVLLQADDAGPILAAAEMKDW